MDDKIKIQQWIINLFIIVLIGSYAFIFNSVLDRIGKNEVKIDQLNPVFMQIQTDLTEIKTNIIWIKNNK